MAFRLGGNNINKLYLNNNEIKKVYYNNTSVYDKTSTVSLPASTVFNLDATDTNSYDNSTDLQIWKNTVVSPADGSSQSDYDFYRGSSSGSETSDPTFTGTAGSSSAYWSVDGGDFFTHKASSVANVPAFLRQLQRTDVGSDFWFAFAYRAASDSSAVAMLDTSDDVTGTRLDWGNLDKYAFVFVNSGAFTFDRSNVDAGSGALGDDNLVIYSYRHSDRTVRLWENSKTVNDTATLSSFSITSDCSIIPRIGKNVDRAFNNNSRIYSVAMGNVFADNTIAGDIVDYYNEQHNRTYA